MIPKPCNLRKQAKVLLSICLITLCGCDPDFDAYVAKEASIRQTSDWPAYGGVGGSRFSDLELLTKANVSKLEVEWIYRTGDVGAVFQATPIIADGQLIFCTPFNRVVSLDPLTGGELWHFDPEIDRDIRPANQFNCRGVAAWQEDNAAHCGSRIFTATNDARLIALDSKSGSRCKSFADDGEVDLSIGVGRLRWPGEYQVTSPPAIAGNLIIVGSAVSDGGVLEAPSGVVRAYDARTGELRWAFDLAPPGFDHSAHPISDSGYALGAPNVWSAMSVDAERDLVFLPTGNPSPDYYRPGDNKLSFYGSSVVAVRASTGEVVWHFNTVINDFWDFDVPSQPVLADIAIDGEPVPVVIQSTKMGFIFVLHRETGEPVVEVSYEEVPQEGPLAGMLSPVQPFPPAAFRVSRDYEKGGSLLGLCDELENESVIGPIYTPITESWTVGLPSNMGATNWGGVAVDAARGLIAVRTSSVPFRTKLIERESAADLLTVLEADEQSPDAYAEARRAFFDRYNLPDGTEVAPQAGTDYLMARHVMLDPAIGLPCAGVPMGELMVIDIAAEKTRWRRPHGTARDVGLPLVNIGMPGVGGSLITATGLVFAGGIAEKAFRAYDMDTGEELWHHRLPHPANATPMSYGVVTETGNKPFVVVAAGGDGRTGIGGVGDYLIGFSLKE